MPSSLKPMTVASAHHGQVRVRSGVELLTRQSVGGGSVDRLSVGPTTAGTRRAELTPFTAGCGPLPVSR